ncbi:MAG: hypothetical protein HXX80_07445 [Nitrososphaerales archaeon]|nr:hypothetical protein [Nitrososphaerales archaeon]
MSKAIKRGEIIGDLPKTIILDGDPQFSGFEPYNIRGFTKGQEYHPIAMFKYEYESGETVLCFAVPDDEGKIRQVAVTNFKIHKFLIPVGEHTT